MIQQATIIKDIKDKNIRKILEGLNISDERTVQQANE